MAVHNTDDGKPLPPHIIEYDHTNPSPHFTEKQIGYIESIRDSFSEKDLAWIRNFEWFRLNLNSGLAEGSIPGLRYKPGMGALYVRRYSSQACKKMLEEFLHYVPKDFPEADIHKCNFPPYRVTVPNGDRYYPFAFHGDLEHWDKRLHKSAEVHHTLIGQFDHGKFVLSDGQSFDFSAIKVDRFVTSARPKDW